MSNENHSDSVGYKQPPKGPQFQASISKQRALIKRLVASAIDGDARSIATLMSFCARAFGDDNDDQQQAPEDREIVQAFARRSTKRRSKTAVTSNSSKE